MTADTITAIKKALDGVTHAPGKWEAEGTAVYCDDAPGQRVCDTKGDLLFWSEDQKQKAAAYIAATNPVDISELLSTLESLQRENEELKKDRYNLAYAITGGEDAPGLLDSVPTSQLVEIARNTHRSHSADIDRAMAAEAEVQRYREALHIISAGHACPIALANNALRPTALSSTGDTHGN